MMTTIRRSTLAALVLTAGSASSGCECADRPVLEEAEGMDGSTGVEASMTDGATTTGAEAPTTGAAEEPVDVSQFLGVFHNEHGLVPLGEEVDNPGDPALVNIEISADGTASMTMEICSELYGTLEIAWRWEAQPGPWLVFSPGPGEESLRFMALNDLESLRLTTVDHCDLRFEIDGQPPAFNETFRPGRACWVNRCDPSWTVEIDYCEGEDPTPCD